MRAKPTIPSTPLISVVSLILAFGLAVAEPPEARAETVQSCRRKGCRLNVNTYRCICPRRPTTQVRRVRLRCPRGTRQTKNVFQHRSYRWQWGTIYRCVKRRGGKKIPHGPTRKLWTTGVVRYRGHFRNGKEHGTWKWYSRQGKLWWTSRYVDGKLHGPNKRWYPTLQKLQRVGQWREGLRVGVWKAWHKNGKLMEVGSYVKGKQHGVWNHYHPNGGKRMRTPYKNGRLEGLKKIWSAGGKLVRTAPYVGDSLHGRVWSIERGYKIVTHFKRGQMHGLNRSWHKNGVLARETSYYNNVAMGLDRKWNDRRVLILRRRNLSGRYHGLWERWYDNGKLRERGKYLKGRKVGLWVQYAPDGSELNRHTY